MRGAEPARDSKAVVVEIDHDDASRRIELRGEQGRKTDRTCAHDRHAASRRDLPVENPAFIAGGQDVAEHDERFLVRSGGYRVEAVCGMRYADEFRLLPVDGIAQDPHADGTVRIQPATAIFEARAGGDAGDHDLKTED